MNTYRLSKNVQSNFYKLFAVFLALIMAFGNFLPATQNNALAQTTSQPSLNVAIIDSVTVRNGGSFPTTTTGSTGSFLDFNFFILPRANVSLAALEPGGVCGADGCDTVLLNVASTGMACNINNLTAQQKADLVSFVNLGRKLIIYDSECVTQDYSWLPYPFTTVNPGALGAQGALTIVEENTLSSSDPTSPYFIDAVMLGTQTDAVGDMNVMTTYDPNWFLDMSGTNAIGYTGPVHTYASLPPGSDAGLIIYNGLDVDYMNTGTIPNSGTPAGNLAKIWLQELQQLFNPSDLPGTNPVVGIALSPETATLNLNTDHTVTATLTNLLGDPQTGIQVTFSIDSGPNTGATGVCAPNSDCTSDLNGQVNFTYTGSGGIGIDQIRGCFTNTSGQVICSQYVTAEWIITTQPVVDYFALGDSIASGHGLMDDGTPCHRSDKAYPHKVDLLLRARYDQVNFHFLACSGATALYDQENIQLDQYKWLHNQVDFVLANLTDNPTLVSITIGANDFQWSEPLNFFHRLAQPGDSYLNWATLKKTQVGNALRAEVERLIAYPNVAVVITQVHNPVNQESRFFTLFPGRPCANIFNTVDCYDRMAYGVDLLNTAYVLDVWVPLGRPTNVRVTPTLPSAFSGGESPQPVCGSASPDIGLTLIQYPGDPNSNSPLPQVIRRLWGLGDAQGDCFHPNEAGAFIYAGAVDESAEAIGR